MELLCSYMLIKNQLLTFEVMVSSLLLELSDVVWSRTLRPALSFMPVVYFAPVVYVFFIYWAFFTITILVVMEGLSAFLHTLRLHW